MKKSLKPLLWIVVLVMSISMIAVFSLAGCKDEAVEEVKEEEAVEEEAEESETDVQDLFEACEKGNLEDVKRLLGQSADVNIKNIDDWTVLMIAAEGGHTEIAETLIDNGADVNAKTNDDWTALKLAVAYGHTEAAKMLIDNGADVDEKENDGWTALMIAAEGGHTEIAEMLIYNDADINAKENNGWTALMLAVAYGHTEIAEMLIYNDADVNVKNSDGWTALMISEDNGYTEIADLIRGASKEVTDETEKEAEEQKPVEETFTVPTISLEIIEGPIYSQLGDNTCYYRVRANVTGNPSPVISFNRDDSSGSLGKNISQINLHNKGESFTLEATATNSQGTASNLITLSYACQDHIPIIITNNTGGNVSVNLSGPANFNFNIPPGQLTIYVVPGTYNYTGRGCGGSTLSGTEDLSRSEFEWVFWCE